MQDRIGDLLGCGRHGEAAAELPGLVADDPHAERLAGMLMVALYRCGRRADALAVFRDARGRLADDLGVEPGRELQQLHQQILAGDRDLAGEPDGGLGGGGSRRRRAVAAGEVTQLPAGGERGRAAGGAGQGNPGDNAAEAGRVIPRQLPAAARYFTGREAELGLLSGLLSEGEGSAGTVVISAIGGMAGVGKTALALHWAHEAATRFADGQLYVNLRGFGPAGDPVSSETAVRGFLEALGVWPERVPADHIAVCWRAGGC